MKQTVAKATLEKRIVANATRKLFDGEWKASFTLGGALDFVNRTVPLCVSPSSSSLTVHSISVHFSISSSFPDPLHFFPYILFSLYLHPVSLSLLSSLLFFYIILSDILYYIFIFFISLSLLLYLFILSLFPLHLVSIIIYIPFMYIHSYLYTIPHYS